MKFCVTLTFREDTKITSKYPKNDRKMTSETTLKTHKTNITIKKLIVIFEVDLECGQICRLCSLGDICYTQLIAHSQDLL